MASDDERSSISGISSMKSGYSSKRKNEDESGDKQDKKKIKKSRFQPTMFLSERKQLEMALKESAMGAGSKSKTKSEKKSQSTK